ncbi:MAG: TraR/DksA C4-type zinc finger protein [Rubrivivax sp.]|nr:TraR/DksA C4-type zinc finger protein [Rubrivivax sp.]
MSSHLTPGQRALLKAALEQRQHQLDRRLADHLGGRSRAEHAREVATQDEDDPPQRESEREMDMALSDFETQEVGEVSEALRRIETDAYGLCSNCGTEIPFDRLKAEPWAERCVPCESAREKALQRRRG